MSSFVLKIRGAELPKLLYVFLVGETYLDDVKVDPVEYAGFFGSLSVAGDSPCHAGAGGWFLAGSGFGEDSVGNVGHGGRGVGVMGWGGRKGSFSVLCFVFFGTGWRQKDLGSFHSCFVL